MFELKDLKYRYGSKDGPNFKMARATLQGYFGRYLCSFRNTRGGTLLIGVSDEDKIVTGVRFCQSEVDIEMILY